METNENAVSELSIADLRNMVAGKEPETPAAPVKDAKPAPASDPETTQEKERDASGKFKPAAKADDEGEQVPAGVQKRIDKAVKAQREAERRAEEAEAKLAGTPGSQPAKKDTAQPPAAQAPQGKPVAADFNTYEEYVEALTDWKADVRDAKNAQAAEARNREAAYKQRVAAAKEIHADLDEVLADNATMPINRAMHEAIVDSDIGPRLAYYLATNPDEAARINALGANAAARAMGVIEDRLKSATPTTPAKTATPAKPLPKPAKAVGGANAPHEVDLNDESLDMATFKREFRKRLAS